MSRAPRAAGAALALVCRLVLGVVASLGLLAVAPNAVGLPSTVVMSDSMAPGIRAGDVVVVRSVPVAEVRVGQVVLVDDPDFPGRLRLHRLAGRRGADLVLKGDANAAADAAAVHPSALHGVGFLRVPWIGLPILWLRTGDWPLAATAVGGVALLALAVARFDADADGTASERLRGLAHRVLRRAATPTGGAAALVVLCGIAFGTGAAIASEPSWSVFSSTSSSPSNSWATSTFDCPSRSGLPTPALYWSFMPASGTTEPNLGNAGSNYNGTLSSSALRVGGTCSGNASPYVRFTGSGTESVTSAAQVQASGTATESVWFSPSTASGMLLSVGSGTTPSAVDRQIYFTSSGTIAFAMHDGGGMAECSIPGAVALNQWHLAVVVYDDTMKTFVLYLDGSGTSCSGSVTSPGSVVGNLRLATDALLASDAATGSYAGGIDEIGVWTSALQPSDVQNIWAAGH